MRCDRTFPVCTHCYGRNEDCDLHLWPPKTKNDEVSGAEKLRISLLEQRLGENTSDGCLFRCGGLSVSHIIP